MLVAVAMVLIVAGSLLFHALSPWRPTEIASNWGFIDDTVGLTFVVTTLGFVAVILFMAYCLYRFPHRPGHHSTYEPLDPRLEILLGVVTTAAVILLLAPGLIVWNQYISAPEDAAEVEAVGAQWSWSFRLPGKDGRLGATDVRFIDSTNPLGVNPVDPRGRDDLIVTNGELHLPLGKPVKVLLRSIDVVHDFYVAQIRAKMDLLPGMVTYLWFTPTRIGEFEILCAAFCGLGHPQMRGKLVVEPQRDYEKWLAAQQSFAQSQEDLHGGMRQAATR